MVAENSTDSAIHHPRHSPFSLDPNFIYIIAKFLLIMLNF
jgi:hypothetical protein